MQFVGQCRDADSGEAIRNSLMLAATGRDRRVRLGVLDLDTLATERLARSAWPPTSCSSCCLRCRQRLSGVALIGLWNRAGVAGTVYGTNGMFLLVYLARFMPLAALALAASLRRVPASHEEAAAVSGAGWFRTMTRIVLPQVRLGLLVVWVIVFTLAFGELGASVLVTPPGESTLPIRIYTLIANAPPAQVAALALLQVAVIFCPLAVLGLGLAVATTVVTAPASALAGVTKVYGRASGRRSLSLDVAAGRKRRGAWAKRLWENDGLAADRRTRATRRRRNLDRRSKGRRQWATYRSGLRTPGRIRLSGPCAVAAPHGPGQSGLRRRLDNGSSKARTCGADRRRPDDSVASTRTWRIATLTSCPAANSSGWRWRARSLAIRVSCCSTSPSRALIQIFA